MGLVVQKSEIIKRHETGISDSSVLHMEAVMQDLETDLMKMGFKP